ncbi:pilus assembly protein [Parasphingopyxis algicola]|uniref:pilus assembly protein n=1 Tax=Parasphingopyxis algicola TaxID=2026624 RepID=UPI0015A1374E|nr:TadE/TadG family type IV pilus assembly protein [Parasphingopyxis algicola]QLC24204.1 pilus assembly protein [Parasphingopyxis algicola]
MGKWLKKIASRRVAKPNSFLARLRRDSRGNTLAMAGAALVPIAGMIGSGLDMSRAYMAQAKMQNACDAAALGARREMSGTVFDADARTEGERFFDFNFPSTTMNAQNVTRTISQSTTDSSTVEVRASADIPTSVMALFGKDFIPISVECDANQDYGNNDIMVVLDVTGSMNSSPSTGGSSKISRLRTGAIGLYRALAGATNTRTRYGFIPYSQSVNIGRDLDLNWVRDPAEYLQNICVWDADDEEWDCTGNGYELVEVDHSSSWLDDWRGNGSYTTNVGSGCIEERATIGQSGSPISISTNVSRDDLDLVSTSNPDRKWAPYDASATHGESNSRCPRPARRLAEYASESAYQSAIDATTGYVSGNTYHDIGLIWASRYISSTGMFASDNPETFNGVPVAKHIVFLTDGEMCPSQGIYSTYGVHDQEPRISGTAAPISGCGNNALRGLHSARFLSACSQAKSMGMTVWVIAFDVTDTTDIAPCATSSGHFYTSDGTDLESVFEQIGAGIGRLRLTQ